MVPVDFGSISEYSSTNPIISFVIAFVIFFILGYIISWFKNYFTKRSQLKTLQRWRVN